jgi:D-glycero-D-manno-heptose 1,7-bisphosphate phosphatase
LFEQIGERFGTDLKEVHAVGDSLRDAQAAAACGCTPHLVLTGKGEQYAGLTLPDNFPAQTHVHSDLAAFADWLLLHSMVKQSTSISNGSA